MQRNIIWKGLNADTEENCAVSYMGDGIIIRSEISGWAAGQPVTVEYVIKLTVDWQVTEFTLTAQTGSDAAQCYAMKRDAAGNWSGMSGIEYPEYHGCDYIDISLTPLTNSLPVNGLKLENGEKKDITVVYIDVLENDVRTDRQRYTKLNPHRYRFENGFDSDNFTADIDVDENGMITNYPQLFIAL